MEGFGLVAGFGWYAFTIWYRNIYICPPPWASQLPDPVKMGPNFPMMCVRVPILEARLLVWSVTKPLTVLILRDSSGLAIGLYAKAELEEQEA